MGTSANRAVFPLVYLHLCRNSDLYWKVIRKENWICVSIQHWPGGDQSAVVLSRGQETTEVDGRRPADSGVVPPWCWEVAGLSMCLSSAWFTTPAAAHTPNTRSSPRRPLGLRGWMKNPGRRALRVPFRSTLCNTAVRNQVPENTSSRLRSQGGYQYKNGHILCIFWVSCGAGFLIKNHTTR